MDKPLSSSTPNADLDRSSDLSDSDSDISVIEEEEEESFKPCDSSYEGSKPYCVKEPGKLLYQQLLFKSNSWAMLPALIVFICQGCKLFMTASLRYSDNKGKAKTRTVRAQWYKASVCSTCKVPMPAFYYLPSACPGGCKFTSSFLKVRDSLNNLSINMDSLKVALETRFALLELISQWDKDSNKKGV